MIKPDQVFALIQQIGPVLPTDITSRTGQNTMIVGAILSTLVAEKRLKITNAKWGSSPLYYTDAQIELIQKIYPQLNEKDRKAFDLLKSQQVLADSIQQPLMRACLRQIKDFAIPLTVTAPDGQEFLFWKWYLLPDEQAAAMIKEILLPQFEKETAPPNPPHSLPTTASAASAPQKSATSAPSKQSSQPAAQSTAAPAPAPASKKSAAKQHSLVEDEFIGSPLLAQKQRDAPKNAGTAANVPSAASAASAAQSSASASAPQSLQAALGSLQPLPTNDDFFTLVHSKLAEKQVAVSSATVVKKNSELDLLISMPTPFGHVTYYAKAKKKKKSTDADLSAVYVKGQMLHLPTAYISLGELTKKAQEMQKTDFAGVLVVRLPE